MARAGTIAGLQGVFIVYRDIFDKSKPYKCPMGRSNPEFCSCASCYQVLAMARAEASINTGFAMGTPRAKKEVMPTFTRQESLKDKIERQRRERFAEIEENWRYHQENKPRYDAIAEETRNAMKGAVWPAYNPLTSEDLTEQLRAALEANHKKAIILTLEDADKTLKDLWEDHGTKTLKAIDKGNTIGGYGAAIYKAYDLAKQFGDYGVKAEVFTSKGKEYIAITTKNNGTSKLKHVLVNGTRLKVNGHKYRINNPKVYQLGLTPQSRVAGFKGSTTITFILSAAINTNELIFNDAFYLTDWFGNVGTDLFKAALAFGAGEAVLLASGLTGGVAIIIGVLIVVGISYSVDWMFNEWKVSNKIVTGIKNAF